MSSIGSMPHHPGGRSPDRVRWQIAAGAVTLGWLAVAVSVLVLGPVLHWPAWLGLHSFLLGAVTTAILYWSEHFTRVLVRGPDQGIRSSAVRLALLNAGVIAVLAGTSTGARAAAGAGAVLVVAAIGWHTAALIGTIRRSLPSGRRRIAWWYVGSSAALLAGGSIGGLLATHLVPDAWHVRLHLAHAHLNLLGWVGLAILGTLYVLLPTVLGDVLSARSLRSVRWTLLLAGAGLVAVTAGLLAGLSWAAAAGLTAYLVAAVWSWSGCLRTIPDRRPKGFAAWSLLAAIAWLITALVVDIALVATRNVGQAADAFPLLYAPLLAGFVGQTLIGSLTRLLPTTLAAGADGERLHARLAWGWRTRFGLANLGVLLALLPYELVRPVGWGLLAVTLAGFVGLAGSAVLSRALGPRAAPVGGALVGALAVVVAGLLTVETPAPTTVDPGKPVDVVLDNMRVRPATVTAPVGSRLLLRITNRDGQRHDLRLASGQRTRLLAEGETALLRTGPLRESLAGWCTVAGHRAAGMTLTIDVGTAPAAHASGGHSAGGHSHGSPSSGESGPASRAHDPVLPPVREGRVHKVEIRVKEIEQEVAPGVRQKVWTFGGTRPGPVLRGRVGDRFVVRLVNDGDIGHGIDFHAGALAPDRPMRTIQPGETLTYSFRAERAGAWLYHCSTPPISQHLANGMYGAVVIDPPDLRPVDREYLLVAGELYRGEPGSEPQVRKIRDGRPDGWMFNGAAGQYGDHPLAARTRERVRFWVVNAGPGSVSAFHVIGTVFDTVYQEGAYLLRPDDPGGAQALDLAPAQGGFVETTFPEPGRYPFVDHDMRHAEGGASGIVVVR